MDRRVFSAFWLLGLTNNVLYSMILAAAGDMVGSNAPKAVVLLADVLPAFNVKLVSTLVLSFVPYNQRVLVLICLSVFGMQVIAHSENLAVRLFGVVFASMSSGLGELTFLQLTHFHGPTALPGFSSGTGAAGLCGSFIYLASTSWLRIPVTTTMTYASFLPCTFFIVFYFVLPQPSAALAAQSAAFGGGAHLPIKDDGGQSKEAVFKRKLDFRKRFKIYWQTFDPYFIPFMLPLGLVYMCQYTINQGISSTLLFSIDDMPFSEYRDAYVAYGTLYQLGVFISRSSSSVIRVRKLFVLAFLQSINVLILISQSLSAFMPSVYFNMVVILFEGLVAGTAYVNTFLLVSETVNLDMRESAIGCVGLSDSAGIILAGFISYYLEPTLCNYQVMHGRPWCQLR